MLLAIQPGVFNLAVRMLGNREDAADARLGHDGRGRALGLEGAEQLLGAVLH